MKKVTAVLTAFALMFGMLPVAFAITPNLLFSERFSDCAETKKVPYTIKTKGKDANNHIAINDSCDAALLDIRSQGSGHPGISFNLSKKSKTVILNFKINVIENSSDIMLCLTDYTTAVNSRLISFATDNSVKAIDGSVLMNIGKYETGKWQDVSIILQTEQNCYEIYINGAKIGETLVLPSKNNENNSVAWAKNIRAVSIDTYNMTGKNTSFAFERIIAYEADSILSDSQLLEFAKPEEDNSDEIVIPNIDVFSYQDFNELETDATSIGIGAESKRNLIYVDEIPSDEDKSVRLESVCEDSFFVLTSFDRAMNDTFVCDFKVYFHDMKSKVAFTLRDPQPLFIETLIFNTSGQIRDNGNNTLMNYNINTWYRCQLVFNIKEKIYDIYIDGKLISAGSKIESGNLKSIGLVRLHVYPPSMGGSSLNVDDWKTYGGGEIIDDATLKLASLGAGSSHFTNMEKVRAVFSNKLAAVGGGNYFFVNGKRSPFDSTEKTVRAYADSDTLMVPVREICAELQMDVSWNDENQRAYIKNGDKIASFKENEKEYTINDIPVKIESSIKIINGKVFVPINVFTDLLGGSTYSNAGNNLFVVEYADNKLDVLKDGKYISEMGRYLIFDRPSPQNIMEALAERYPNNEHPRIMVEPGGFEKIKALTETDEYMKSAYDNLEKATQPLLTAPLLVYDPAGNGGHILEISREMLRRAKYLGMMFNLTGDVKYANCLWKNLEACGNFPSWYPDHYLDVGEMAFAFAIGYDWLYNHWTKQQRKFLETAIEEKALKITLAQYEGYNQSSYWVVTDNNWNVVCNGGVAIAALAVGDIMPEMTGKIVHYALWGLESMMKEFAPDGGWGEGITYWQYTLKYFVSFASALNTALGDDFGLSMAPGVSKTGYFVLHGTGPKGSFNFADAGTAFYSSPEVLWLSSKLKNPELTKMLLFHRKLYNLGAGGDDLVWYDPEMNKEDTEIELPNDDVFYGVEIPFMRSKYTDVNAVYGAMVGGLNNVNHGQLDAGSFIMDAIGERWFLELGADSYSLPEFFGGKRWNYYRNRAEGHNTLVFNPTLGADQVPSSTAKVIEFGSKPKGAYAIMDLTTTYAPNATDVMRGMMLADDRTTLVVRDEFNLSKPSEMYWFAHTKASIDIAEDGKSAILDIANKKLYVKLDSDLNAKFTVMDAKPLPTSPVYAGQNANSGIKKLTIHMENVTKGYINVKFIPLYMPDETPDFEYLSQPLPLSEWKHSIPDGELIPFGLNEIKVNGEPIDEYDIAQRIYKIKYPFGTTEIPRVEATSEAFDVEVINPDSLPGKAIVIVTDRDNPKKNVSYIIEFMILPQIGVTPPGSKEQKITAVTASDVPQPENPPKSAIDGDLSTRWAAFGVQWIQFDLGEVCDVTNIALAWMNANQRIYPFEVHLSTDGENFTNVLTTENSKTTNDLETYQIPKTKARYVRVKSFGNSVNEWCSMTEAKIYVTQD